MNDTTETTESTGQIKGYVVEIDGRDWTVRPFNDVGLSDGGQQKYIVEYAEKDKSQIVDLSSHSCTGTYYKYNDTCPHIQACERVKEHIEGTEESRRSNTGSKGLSPSDAVYCGICDKVHAGDCDFQSLK